MFFILVLSILHVTIVCLFQVADFGLTKLTEVGGTSLQTRVVGTFGYMPPEYVSSTFTCYHANFDFVSIPLFVMNIDIDGKWCLQICTIR
jgi:serine/threonine protein kinase